jgi:hypothetical protein
LKSLTKNNFFYLHSIDIITVWCGSILTFPPPLIKRLNSTRKQSDVCSFTSTYSFEESLVCPFLFPCPAFLSLPSSCSSDFCAHSSHYFYTSPHYFPSLMRTTHCLFWLLTLNHAGDTRSWLLLLMTATSTCSILLSIGESSQMRLMMAHMHTSNIHMHTHMHTYMHMYILSTPLHSSLLQSNILWYHLFSILLHSLHSISTSIFLPQ